MKTGGEEMETREPYSLNENSIFVPTQPVEHRKDEFDPAWFDVMRDMQARHFWYLGRHRFLLRSLEQSLHLFKPERGPCLNGIDLGGGCGGWIRYLKDNRPKLFDELALADSSLRALALAEDFIGTDVKRYQIDLLRLHWKQRWDVAFLLDVLEHIPNDLEVLRQIQESLRPGGLLIVATPALNFFWTYIDNLNDHVRRYSRKDFSRLASQCGLQLCFTRYFMFYLSPLLLLSRWKSPDIKNMSEREKQELMRKTHTVPSWPINQALRLIFSLETPLGVWLPFPWGASVVAVFRKEM